MRVLLLLVSDGFTRLKYPRPEIAVFIACPLHLGGLAQYRWTGMLGRTSNATCSGKPEAPLCKVFLTPANLSPKSIKDFQVDHGCLAPAGNDSQDSQNHQAGHGVVLHRESLVRDWGIRDRGGGTKNFAGSSGGLVAACDYTEGAEDPVPVSAFLYCTQPLCESLEGQFPPAGRAGLAEWGRRYQLGVSRAVPDWTRIFPSRETQRQTSSSESVQECKLTATQGTLEYKGSDYTLALAVGKPDFSDKSAVFVGHYLQSVTKRLSLGAELVYQVAARMAGGEIAIASAAGRYTMDDSEVSATLGAAGFHLCYFKQASEQLQVVAEMDTSFRGMESVGTIGYQVTIPKAELVFRGMVDSNWNIGAVLEKKLQPSPSHLPSPAWPTRLSSSSSLAADSSLARP
ncbi:hypothetical protein MSG28_011599 [Choristoneura fumiferana]|uniref:Uncharacterized protein n=1 Tax=Choristoneura fumiferana TaxID=7141 RepID=A0ACC0JP52_CHOFU|nr:hypothetical protein MSG28_011599 [Choristoneura fumiferana]